MDMKRWVGIGDFALNRQARGQRSNGRADQSAARSADKTSTRPTRRLQAMVLAGLAATFAITHTKAQAQTQAQAQAQTHAAAHTPSRAAGKTYDPVSEDPVVLDKAHPPLVHEVVFRSGGVKLYGKVFSAQGTAPRPTVLIARGFPDMTSSADIALVLQRAGYNAMIFNYRGAWGMKGEFSLENSYQDLVAATNFLRSYRTSQNMLVDPNNILVYGYSLGGPIVMRLAAQDSLIRGVMQIDGVDARNYVKMGKLPVQEGGDDMANPAVPLANGRKMAADVIDHYADWDPAQYRAGLAGKDVLLVWASQGNGHDTSQFGATLRELVGDKARVTEKSLDTNHDFSDQRITLARTVLSWLKQVHLAPASFAAKPAANERKEIALDAAELGRYVGTYQFAGVKLFARAVEGRLEVADANQQWKTVTAYEDQHFMIKGDRDKDCADIETDEDDKGRVVSFTQHCQAGDRVWVHQSSALQLPTERAGVMLDDAALARYAGRYQPPADMHVKGPMEVRVDGKRLIVVAPAGENIILFAQSDGHFFDKVIGMEMDFTRDEQGQVKQMQISLRGRQFTCERL